MKKIKKETIIEFLIVVIVISILGFITYKQFSLAEAKSRDVQRKNDLQEVSKAIRLYFADYGHLPAKDLDINKLWGKNFTDDKGYEYMKNMPKENSLSDKPYCYMEDKTNGSFTLFAQLEDSSDVDCKKDGSLCGGVKYCYTNNINVNDSTK